MSVVLQIYAIIVTLSLIIVLSFYLFHRREVTRLSQKLQTLLHSFTHAELTLDFPSSDITDLVNALNELLTGFSAIKKMSQLVHNNDWSSISMRIQQAYQYALRMSNFTAMIHCDDNDYEEVFELTQDLLNKLNAHETKSEIVLLFIQISDMVKLCLLNFHSFSLM